MCMKIALTNLGKYNEGVLDFVWLELPATETEIEEAFNDIQVSYNGKIWYSDGMGHASENAGGAFYGEYEEVFITDYECDFYEVGEYENIDSLNEIAELFDGIPAYERDVVKGLVKECGLTLEEAIDQADNVYIYSGCYDYTDCAYQYIEETGLLDGVPDSIANYFDYEAFGRDMSFEGQWFHTDGGMACLLY